MQSEKKAVRIGMVNFINTAPLYEIWQRTAKRPDWRVTEAPPAVLCRMLYNNELDFGLVSCHEYAVHPASYRILSGLSISASGPVGSVFLFSEVEPDRLGDQLVLLSSLSQTSVGLVKVVLEEFYKVRPRYEIADVMAPRSGLEPPRAVLAIGDNALRINRASKYPICLDLGEIWHQHTGLPFVFAIWAVREEFLGVRPDTVAEVHRELKRCQAAGRLELKKISRKVAPKIPMAEEECYDYLKAMEYDLDSGKRAALQRFFEYLIKRGEADPGALPLKIYQEKDLV